VLGIVATVVSLIDSIVMVEQCINCQPKEAVYHYGKSITSLFSSTAKSGTKVAKLPKDFDIPTTTLTTVSKNKCKIITYFFLSKHK